MTHENETQKSVKKIIKGKKRSPARKAAVYLFRSVLLLTAVVLILLVILFAAVSGKRAEYLAEKYYSRFMNGRLEMDVERFSLSGGFDIRNISIFTPDPFSGRFVHIDRFVLDYSLWEILRGRILIREAGIYSPRIELIQKNGKWNFESIAKESAPQKESAESGSAEPEINLPVQMEFLLKFILRDLSLSVRSDDFKAELRGFDFSTDVYIPPVKMIPRNVSAVKLIEKFSISVNPQEKLDLSFESSDASVRPPLILGLSLELAGKDGEKKIESRFRAGTYGSPVRFRKSNLGALDFQLSYDIYMDPIKDYLAIRSMDVKFKNNKWISLSGRVDDVSGNQKFNISMKESLIDLDNLFPYYAALTGDRSIFFGGRIRVYPLNIRGGKSDILTEGKVVIEKLRLGAQSFELKAERGSLDYRIQYSGAESDISASFGLYPFFYKIDGSWSKKNNLFFSCDVNSYGNFGSFLINSMDIKYSSSPESKNAFAFSAKGRLSKAKNFEGNLDISPLEINVREIEKLIPPTISGSLKTVPLNKSVSGRISAAFSAGDDVNADLKSEFAVSDFGLKDLRLNAGLTSRPDKKRIDIKEISLGSREFGVSLFLSGMIEQKNSPLSDSDLKLVFSADSGGKTIRKNGLSLSGKAEVNAIFRGGLNNGMASGRVNVKKLDFSDSVSKLSVNGLNMNFPFEYSLKKAAASVSMLAKDKAPLISNSNLAEKDNFSIDSVKMKHPSRDEQIEIAREIRASMAFSDNAFRINSFSALALNGSVASDGIFFNLADMKTKNMEYRLSLKVSNIDIAKMSRVESSRSTKGELSLNMDISGRSVDFSSEFPDVNGYINIYKIEDKFANRLMKELSEEKGKSKLGVTQKIVDHFNLPKVFYFNIDSGNIYATVLLKRKTIGNILHIEDDKIQYDRISLKEYLGKVGRKGDE